MSQFVSILQRCYRWTLITLNYISVFVIFMMAFWVFCDVSGRFFFNHPIPGTTELVKCYIVTIVFLGVAYTMNQRRHIRTTLILDRLSPTGRACCEILASVTATVIFAALCYYSFQEAWVSWLVREFDGVQVRVPVYPSRFVVVIGSGLLVIQGILEFFEQVGVLKNPHKRHGP